MSETQAENPSVEVSDDTQTETAVEPQTETSADVETVVEAAPTDDAPAAEAASDEATEEAAAGTAEPEAAVTPEAEAAATPEAEAAATPEAEAAPVAEAEAEAAPEAEAAATPEAEAEKTPEPTPKPAKGAPVAGAATSSLSPAVVALQEKMDANEMVNGKVIGWNKGGFHVVCEGVTGFCPNSEMELGKVKAPKDYLDMEFDFSVLRIEDAGRRVVLSRGKLLEGERSKKRAQARAKVEAGAEIEGKVASLTNFGAFVDVGGAQGLVHVSEISRRRVEDPSEVLSVGQRVKVKVLKVEQGGKRISLSMKALEPDPWKGVGDRFPEGSVVQGTVERTAKFGAFVALEPGLTGLLPASVMNLPRDAQINRMYSPGKQITVMVMSVDPRRRRISLALEGSQSEGSRSDYEAYKKSQQVDKATGFNALAAAFQKLDP